MTNYNNFADNIVERYVCHDPKVVRIGHPARVSPNSIDYTLDVLCSGGNKNQISNKIRKELRLLSLKLRASANISEKNEMNIMLKKLNTLFKKKITRKEQTKQLKNANVIFSTLNG